MAFAAAWLCALCVLPAAAIAHQSNPNFDSEVRTVTPATKDVSAQILGGDDRVLLADAGGHDVVVFGYSGEPYIWIRRDRTVLVNQNSPAVYLNQDRYGAVTVPAHASAAAPPLWEKVAGTGTFDWHDHRIHWMSKSIPPSVKDRAKRTKIFAWNVPVKIDGRKGAILGTLYWRGNALDQGPGSAATIGFALIVIALIVFSVVMLRMRSREPEPERKDREAW